MAGRQEQPVPRTTRHRRGRMPSRRPPAVTSARDCPVEVPSLHMADVEHGYRQADHSSSFVHPSGAQQASINASPMPLTRASTGRPPSVDSRFLAWPLGRRCGLAPDVASAPLGNQEQQATPFPSASTPKYPSDAERRERVKPHTWNSRELDILEVSLKSTFTGLPDSGGR
jgi:hypothetical protein